jgi:hypothetical protein
MKSQDGFGLTSRECLLAAWTGKGYDHPPLSAWCFGFRAPPHLRWRNKGREVRFWYSMRMEHIHTLPEPWELEDDFRRVEAWQSLGVDDLLEVSVPWGLDPAVTWKDSQLFGGRMTLVGGINSTTFSSLPTQELKRQVHRAMEALAGTGRFILQPVRRPSSRYRLGGISDGHCSLAGMLVGGLLYRGMRASREAAGGSRNRVQSP